MFKKNDIINKKFEVLFPIQNTTFGSSYRVKNIEDSKIYMLKIYEKVKLQDWHFNKKGDLIESEIHKQIDHPNIAKFISCELIKFEKKELYIYVVEFINGETLQEHIEREGKPDTVFATMLMKKIMSAIDYLHSKSNPIIHADITPLNIMLDVGADNEPILFDFGLSKQKEDKTFYNTSVPSIFYCAPEIFNNESSTRSDIFSLGALFYTLMEGFFPWRNRFGISEVENDGENINLQEKIIDKRNSELIFFNDSIIEKNIKSTIKRALSLNPDTRYNSIKEMTQEMDHHKDVDDKKIVAAVHWKKPTKPEKKSEEKKSSISKKSGDGFKKVAGMDDLKILIREEVIEPLQEPESFKDYHIEPPNGILFYGPPGCGKTFFAECLSEEIGFNFVKVGPSDVGSTYVHGSQEKIKKLFDSAKKNAPTILFLDEIDAMIPDRESSDISHHYASEVNEWLIQFNNCSEQEVFIIGATNKMNKIDSAVLRSGRFDRKILVPVPDFESRKSLFKLYLDLRKKVVDNDIDYDKLSELTLNFVCSDIKLIVNDASRAARKIKANISQKILENIISETSSSISEEEISKYSKNKKTPKKSIGFNAKNKK